MHLGVPDQTFDVCCDDGKVRSIAMTTLEGIKFWSSQKNRLGTLGGSQESELVVTGGAPGYPISKIVC